ncbi:hypothetical protein OV203_35625 [Nannocystis sp. ILAH1]|uniref:hypothetical protein n=1 Tax=Nannocystis sp. ILAH1 TaxID=2996789 RepID=UPI00226E70A6|nr:hypothetical protein [Nannocystis sp. ILAH1]MCY0992525.1 hypothetical protein [Nannocystis sp. ILAH1]
MELNGEFPDLGIELLGVNGAGFESGVPQMASGRFIPLLQDVAEVDAWTQWEVVYRDVIILDRDGAPVGVFNLTEHDLSMMGEYEALKGMLLDVAMM